MAENKKEVTEGYQRLAKLSNVFPGQSQAPEIGVELIVKKGKAASGDHFAKVEITVKGQETKSFDSTVHVFPNGGFAVQVPTGRKVQNEAGESVNEYGLLLNGMAFNRKDDDERASGVSMQLFTEDSRIALIDQLKAAGADATKEQKSEIYNSNSSLVFVYPARGTVEQTSEFFGVKASAANVKLREDRIAASKAKSAAAKADAGEAPAPTDVPPAPGVEDDVPAPASIPVSKMF